MLFRNYYLINNQTTHNQLYFCLGEVNKIARLADRGTYDDTCQSFAVTHLVQTMMD
jgi:hypothetical protein